MKKDDTKLLKLVEKLLGLIATDAYASGEGFEFMLVEEGIGETIDRLPLPQHLKQVRGAIYKSKGQSAVKDTALWMVTNRASMSPKLSDEVALYILGGSHDRRIRENLQQNLALSDTVRDKARQLAESQSDA